MVLHSFTVSHCESKAYPQFTDPVSIEKPVNMGRMYPDFSGYYRYETDVTVPACKQAVLTVADAGETCRTVRQRCFGRHPVCTALPV